jgi:hypothetical protein
VDRNIYGPEEWVPVSYLKTKCKGKRGFLDFSNGSHGRKEQDPNADP